MQWPICWTTLIRDMLTDKRSKTRKVEKQKQNKYRKLKVFIKKFSFLRKGIDFLSLIYFSFDPFSFRHFVFLPLFLSTFCYRFRIQQRKNILDELKTATHCRNNCSIVNRWIITTDPSANRNITTSPTNEWEIIEPVPKWKPYTVT